MQFLQPKHTLSSVLQRLAKGLTDGSIVLQPRTVEDPTANLQSDDLPARTAAMMARRKIGLPIPKSLLETLPDKDRENEAYVIALESLVVVRTEQLQKVLVDLERSNEARAELERSYDITVEALLDALNLKESELGGHSKRVTAFTIAIARAMGISGDKIRVIARGAFLHDIGMIAVPDHILRKPGALTLDETQVMREHCFRGYQMLKDIPFLAEAAEIVYAHQERYDGTGYPRGLKANKIPLGARIISVADTLDAITSDHPYRAAQNISAARDEVVRFSGRQFDPQVVSIFLQMPETIWEDLRKEINSKVYRFAHAFETSPPIKARVAGRTS